jgi:hypothetical protein
MPPFRHGPALFQLELFYWESDECSLYIGCIRVSNVQCL